MASGKDGRRVRAIVGAGAPGVIDLVTGEFQGAFEGLVAHPPVADLRPAAPFVVGPVLHEDRSGLGSVLRTSTG